MARPAGFPLLLLLPFILGCFSGACHASVFKEDLDAKSNSVALFDAPMTGDGEAEVFRHLVSQFPDDSDMSYTSCLVRIPFRFIGAFLDYVYDRVLVGDGCYELREAFRRIQEAVRVSSSMMLYYLEHEGCSRIGNLLDLVQEFQKFSCYMLF